MKSITLFLCSFFCVLTINAQSVLHFSFDTNGPMGECLFPQNENGEIVISEIVDADSVDAVTIGNIVISAIKEYASYNSMGISNEFNGNLSWSASINYPVNKQIVTHEVFGSPVSSYLRDASKVLFTCKLEFRNGKFKYTLKDFITRRRQIHGEAKSNGPSNVIHWQRVNSLMKERQSYIDGRQSYIGDRYKLTRRDREVIYDYDEQIEYEKILYESEYRAVMDFVASVKSCISNRRFFDADSSFDEELSGNDVEEYKVNKLDLSDYHGNLLAGGNNVFIVEQGEQYEIAGALELKKQIIIDQYWKIVNNPEEAHFILKYTVSTIGRDKATLTISDNEGNAFYAKSLSASESVRENREVARELYLEMLYGVPEKIQNNRIPVQYKRFNR